LAGAARAAAVQALGELRAVEPALARSGPAALRRLGAALLAFRDEDWGSARHAQALQDEARSAWLAQGASFAERRAAKQAATDAAIAATDAAEADWAALWAALERAGLTALRLALPFLLAAAGL